MKERKKGQGVTREKLMKERKKKRKKERRAKV